MSVARAAYPGYSTAAASSAAPLGVTHGGVSYGTVTTVQAPTVVVPPQVTTASAMPQVAYATAPSAAAEPVMVAGGGATYANPAAQGVTYAYPGGGYVASPVPAGVSLFDALDRNHDGVITRSEFAAYPQAAAAAAYPQYAAEAGAMPQHGMAAPMMDPAFQFPVDAGPGHDDAPRAAGGPAPKAATDGVATPTSVEQQKKAYAQALATQLEEGKRTIKEQSEQAKAILQQQAEEKKIGYSMQIDQQLLEQEMNLDQQTHQQVMQLTQVAFHQKSLLEAQASKLTMEYKQRKMQEALEEKKYELQLRQCDLRDRQAGAAAGGRGGGGGGMGEPLQQEQYAGAIPAMGSQPAYEPSIPQTAAPAQPSGGIVSGGSAAAAYAPPTQYHTSQQGGTPQYSSAQFSSAQFGQPGGTPTAGYAAPPTHYAAPPTQCGVPQTAFGAGVAPQTSITPWAERRRAATEVAQHASGRLVVAARWLEGTARDPHA
eukprot:CAMPEP_0176059058 /NCGR_PEP_ID=MMETSP0120_2-20121206/29430_1 /TAXON_ID=160619 /ORGANISM="Kryptoperidinium foliaceum, Strain CCMP 1326" /LENGTH=484 /DNA_ID=CAMNT_0017392593 /DNA_START=67 /DNA_END=1520 /DNA_ORIENTATION=-